MTITVPDTFVEVTQEEFWHLLSNLDWRCSAYCGGEYFEVKRLWSRRVGLHTTDDHYYIDRTFFKATDNQ